MTITTGSPALVEAARTARDYADAHAHRGDAQTVAMLANLDGQIAAIRDRMRITAPPGTTVNLALDSRLDLFVTFANELRQALETGTAYAAPAAAEPPTADGPKIYALTAEQIRDIRLAEFVRGYDAGWEACEDNPIEVDS